MKKYQKILNAIMEKEGNERDRAIDNLMDTMHLTIDESPYITALEDGIATLTALYVLCTIHNINTVNYYQEMQDRLEYLTNDLLGDMLEKFPPRLPIEED